MVDDDAALGEVFLDVPVGQGVPQVPAHCQHDHFRWEPEPGELRDRSWWTGTTTHHLIMPHGQQVATPGQCNI
jgi:hypothetical protein